MLGVVIVLAFALAMLRPPLSVWLATVLALIDITKAVSAGEAAVFVTANDEGEMARAIARLLDDSGERTLEMAVRRLSLSARAHDRILKVARTVADLDRAEMVSSKHLAEAVQYRSLDRNYWQ